MRYKKRKDRKGHVLKTGETQRKDGTYQYSYTNKKGERKFIYAPTLDALRKKETEIQKSLNMDLDYHEASITVIVLVERYIKLKDNLRYNSKVNHRFVLNMLKNDDFGYMKIRNVKVSDAKAFILRLHQKYKRNTLYTIKGVLGPAFQMAFDDGILYRNPFAFEMKSLDIEDDSDDIKALTKEEQEMFLGFIKNSKTYSKYYDEIVLLLKTGLRISEFCAITEKSLDFDKGIIHVDYQLQKEKGGVYVMGPLKTKSGKREVPMSVEVYDTFFRIVEKRKEQNIDWVVDGHSGFLFLDKDMKPKTALHYEKMVQRAKTEFNETHEYQLKIVTPHVFRHTFCTELAEAGMLPQNLQYIMGHADFGTTMKYYVDKKAETANKAMGEVVPLAMNKMA